MFFPRRLRRSNAPDPVRYSERVFRRFNRRAPSELSRIKLDLSRPLIYMGEVPEIHYISDKEGEPVHYMHNVDKPGILYGHPAGKFFVIYGGSTRVGEWLQEERSNPQTVLSRTNIERAIQSYMRLTPRRRKEISDVQGYIAATAWEIQRARLKKHGHR